MADARADAGPGSPWARFPVWALAAWLAITLAWWALAFAPLPAPEAWLAQARAVCFGTLPNGLPDTWGWGALVVSPLAVLAILLAVWGGELRRALGAMADRWSGLTAIGLAAALPFAGLLWVGQRVVEARAADTALDTPLDYGPLPPDYPRGTERAPELGLTNQRGERVTLASLAGKPVLVTFAFGHCLTICPVVVNTVREAAASLDGVETATVVVSLDPWRDTPRSLPSLLAAWRLDALDDAHVLSGSVEEVLAVLEAWNVPIQRDEKTGDISHPAFIAVLAGDGARAYAFSSPPTDWVVEAVRRVAPVRRASLGP